MTLEDAVAGPGNTARRTWRGRRCFGLCLGLALVLGLGTPHPAGSSAGRASPVVVLSSMRIRPYEQLARKFQDLCKGREVKVLYLDEKPDAAETLASLGPVAIVTVGQEALRKALPKRGGTPLVYTMVLAPRELLPSPLSGVSGIAMVPSPRQELQALQRGFKVRKLALFSNPSVSGPLVKDLQAMAPEGMEFAVVAVRSDREMLRSLESGLPQADGILLIPDATVLSGESLKKLMSASYTSKVPVFGFSPLYLDMGAAATLSVAEDDVAGKAVSLALNISNGPSDQVEDLYYLRSCLISLNGEAEKRLSLKTDRVALNQFGRVVERR
jgi:ABC-type uncharacterized transport system substrate-binding protein